VLGRGGCRPHLRDVWRTGRAIPTRHGADANGIEISLHFPMAFTLPPAQTTATPPGAYASSRY
jgi:hypothetical protein